MGEAFDAAGLSDREMQVALTIHLTELDETAIAELLEVSRQYISKLATSALRKLERAGCGTPTNYADAPQMRVVHYGDTETLDTMMYGRRKRHQWGAGPD